jgi:calcium channel MID1
MQLPRHTPLQSRLLASTITASLFVVLWTCFQTLQFAYAAEIAIPPELLPHNELKYSIPQASPDSIDVRGETKGVAEHDGLYAPDFTYFDRYLIGRQQEQVRNLTNDKILYTEIVQKATLFFTFEKTQTSGKGTRSVPLELLQDRSTENTSERDVLGEVAGEENIEGESLEGGLRKRQSGRAVWVSANTCSQPTPSNNNGTDSPSQLILHVSTSEQKPTNSSKDTTHIPFVGGFANFTTNTTSDLYMGVSASELPDKWTGGWSFEIAASVNGYYHSYNDTEYMHMVDTDSDSTLFVSFPLQNSNKTEDVLKWNNTMPFTFHAYPTGNWSGMIGLERSFCKLRDVTDGVLVKPDLTQLFDDKRLPKAQFNVQGLKTNQTYTGFLAVTGGTTDMDLYNGGTVRGGGQVFKQFNWTTKAGKSPIPSTPLPDAPPILTSPPT